MEIISALKGYFKSKEQKLEDLRETLHINKHEWKEKSQWYLNLAKQAWKLAESCEKDQKFNIAWAGFYLGLGHIFCSHEEAEKYLKQFEKDYSYLESTGKIPKWRMLEMKGTMQYIFGNVNKSLEALEQALYILMENQDFGVEYGRIMGGYLMTLEGVAPKFAAELSKLLSPEVESEARVKGYLQISSYLYQNLKYRMGYVLGVIMIEICKNDDVVGKRDLGSIYNLHCLHLGGLGRNEESIQYGQLALEALASAEDPHLIACCKNNIGLGLQHLGRFGEALSYFEQAWVEKQAIPDVPVASLIPTLRGLGDCCASLGKYESAEVFLFKGFDLARDAKNPEIWMMLNSIANMFLMRNEFGKAIDFYKLCVDDIRAGQGEDSFLLAQALDDYSVALKRAYRYEEAIETFEKGKLIYQKYYSPESNEYKKIEEREKALREESAAYFQYQDNKSKVILQIVVETVAIDGEIHEREICRALKIIREMTNLELSATDITNRAQEFLTNQKPPAAVKMILESVPRFVVYDLELFVRLAYSLIRSDGVIKDSESQYLNNMGQQLGFTHAHFRGILNEQGDLENFEDGLAIWCDFSRQARKQFSDFDGAIDIALKNKTYERIYGAFYQLPAGAFLLYELAKDTTRVAYLETLDVEELMEELNMQYERIKIEQGV